MGIVHLLKKIRSLIIESPETKQYGKLDVLIERAEKRMRIKPQCPYGCGASMVFRHSAISGGGIGAPKGSPIRDDQVWKCTHCFHTAHFGIPISKEEAEEELRLRGGRYLTRPTFRKDETYRIDVRKRLEKLGYFDFGD